MKPFLPGLVLAVVLLFLQAMSDLSLPRYMSGIVSAVIAQNTGEIPRIGLLMLLIALAGGTASVAVSLLSSKIAAGLAKNLPGGV